MSLDLKIEQLSKLATIQETLHRGDYACLGLQQAIDKIGDEVNTLISVNAPAATVTTEETKTEAPPAKKETPPKSTKKVTAADIIDDKPESKAEEPAPEVVDEVSLTDDEAEDSLTDDEPKAIDYEALRTECRGLINLAVDRAGKPAIVGILGLIQAKSLKDVKDSNLQWLKDKLLAAK